MSMWPPSVCRIGGLVVVAEAPTSGAGCAGWLCRLVVPISGVGWLCRLAASVGCVGWLRRLSLGPAVLLLHISGFAGSGEQGCG